MKSMKQECSGNLWQNVFADGDYQKAQSIFMESYAKRPDILMEASDITGELHLCMQVISTCSFEQELYGHNLFRYDS